ncbi:MAG: isocitrate/isopropylmalate dehydrogenase family protein [Thermoplasmata archaeon]|nr:isocitrate/isopropylmalate dehydrogenase family protein [Thermoplasmata archaeon]
MEDREVYERAATHFNSLIERQMARIDGMKEQEDWVDYSTVDPLVVGVVGGDGIGPIICDEARRVMEFLLEDRVAAGKVEVRTIEGLTIENRAAQGKPIPEDILAELRKCHVILKGPTTTPSEGDEWPNIESANVAMRKELDLFANVRPVKVPEAGIDWIFFRENTEGAYALGSDGIAVTDQLAIDFTVTTAPGSERILELAFDYADRNGIDNVTVVTKSNVIKTTDGLFLNMAKEVAKRHVGIRWENWFIDIMTAKLIDPARRTQFRVMVMPNLYGDILTDEAAQMQGGVGTAGAANIGKRYAMFEAIHGSAPRMVDEGRAQYADPQSMMRAVVMLLDHIGNGDEADKLSKALDICGFYEKRISTTGRPGGATAAEFSRYVMETIRDPGLVSKWQSYQA